VATSAICFALYQTRNVSKHDKVMRSVVYYAFLVVVQVQEVVYTKSSRRGYDEDQSTCHGLTSSARHSLEALEA
jgi:hypothetical protein